MKIYLAGPMRGIPEFNFPAFFAAATKLREQGHEVFNPAERDQEQHGDVKRWGAEGDIVKAVQRGFSLRQALEMDTTWICRNAQAIALLPGWEKSSGARAEKALGEALGLEVIYLA